MALAFNPAASPFLYALSSGFLSPNSVTRLSVIDPTTWTQVRSINLSGSLNTGREIAIGPDHYLYIAQFAGGALPETAPLIDRLNLDPDGNGQVTLAEMQGLTDNSSVDWHLKGIAASSPFNGLDVAYSGPLGACCCGATCSMTTAAACTGANRRFTGNLVPCNAPGNNTTPCCKADYNHALPTPTITVQDLFDFLGGYFSLNPCADTNGTGAPPTVQDIFDYLAAYFGGC
jgi:hypothetical protein